MSGSTSTLTFYQALTAAIGDMSAHGYDSTERLRYWTAILREAANRSLVPEHVLEEQLNRFFSTTYRRLVDQGQILRHHPGVSRFTLEKLKPHLRPALDRARIASRDLIKLNRAKMIEDVDRKFTGWATSLPTGGTASVDTKDVKDGIRKPLASLPFTERRVHIDQGHKFVANLNNILAKDGGALAAIWHSHWRQRNYNFRKDHKERDEQIYIVRGNWAMERGLIRAVGHLFTDEITMPGEEVYCRCHYEYIYSLQDLPEDMLTKLGQDELRRAKAMFP
jgi:hypothetical protein